ncbi:ABC transporter substrate-binding protein [uncultured Roseovarius sp.]|uniref:ABC transporter substrate-binding protein n=1 Tax=uncultured Roseovarius sp. TaxID=293344 RepID=UPI00261AD69C|nr:ABC transporter substrate-binding protein [uncultured Roseovarius sp.]
MKDELSKSQRSTVQRGLNRRSFLARSAAFGVTSAVGTSITGRSALAGEPKKGGILKLGIGGGATTDVLDPGMAQNSATFMANRIWGDTLFNVTPDGKIEPRIAQELSSNEDATVWTFKIREGVTFHDGSPLSVDDVVATFKRHSGEGSTSSAVGILKGISDISADGGNAVFTLSAGNADLPYLLAEYSLIIQPKGGVENPNAGIGSGAYKLISVEAGVRYQFEKNPDYWDGTRGHYDGIEMLIINDAAARNSALLSGQVHMINRVAPKVAKRVAESDGIHVRNTSGRAHYEFVMLVDTPPFDNKDLRLALKYSINRQEMVDKILNGFGSIGNDIPINSAYAHFDETLPQREFDLEKAAAHYKASGHDGSPIELIVAEAAFPGAVDAATLWQQSCKKAGIPLTVKRVPDDGYWDDVWQKKPFCANYWSGRPVQDQMYATAYISTASWNDTHFYNEEFDALLIEARAELDDARRKELYSKVAHILWEEGGAVVPMFNDLIDAHSDTIAGWESDPNFELMGGHAPLKTWMA